MLKIVCFLLAVLIFVYERVPFAFFSVGILCVLRVLLQQVAFSMFHLVVALSLRECFFLLAIICFRYGAAFFIVSFSVIFLARIMDLSLCLGLRLCPVLL